MDPFTRSLGEFLSLTFSFKILFLKTFSKILEYSIYGLIVLCVSNAPSKFIVQPLADLIITYMLLRESTSLMRKTSTFFKNDYMGNVSNALESAAQKIFSTAKRRK